MVSVVTAMGLLLGMLLAYLIGWPILSRLSRDCTRPGFVLVAAALGLVFAVIPAMGFSIAFGGAFGGLLGGHVLGFIGLSAPGVVAGMVFGMASVLAAGIAIPACLLALVTWAALRIAGYGNAP